MKALLWEGDGFILLYKRLENGSFKWPRDETEVKPITWQQFRWLMEGLNQVSNLTEMVLLLHKDKFGPSSEKTPVQVDGQISLFNEAELEADPDAKEPIHFRKGCAVHRNTKTKREELLKDIPVVEFPSMVHAAGL